jgi:hypothetical protein
VPGGCLFLLESTGSGARASLSGKALKELGLTNVTVVDMKRVLFIEWNENALRWTCASDASVAGDAAETA